MRLNQKTIPHKKLIKVKKNWVIVPLISIVMNNSSLVHASDVNAQHVKDSEDFLSALTNKDVHSIYLERDIKLEDQSLISKLPRRNLLINLSNHSLNWGDNEWQFIDDDWEELSQIKVKFVNGYLNMGEVDQIKKAYDDVNSQIDIELDHINKTSLENHIDIDEGIWGEKLESPSDSSASDYQDKSSVASLDDKNMIENWSSNALSSNSSISIQNDDSQSSVSSGYIDRNYQNGKSESNEFHTDVSQISSSSGSLSSESYSINSSSALTSKYDSSITSQPNSNFVSNSSSNLNSSLSINIHNSSSVLTSNQSLNNSGSSAAISNSSTLFNRASDNISLVSSATASNQSLNNSVSSNIVSSSTISSKHASNNISLVSSAATSNQSLNNSGNSNVVSNSTTSSKHASKNISLVSSAATSNQSLNNSGNSNVVSNSTTSSNYANNSNFSSSSAQNINEFLSNNNKLLDYLNLFPKLKQNQSVDYYSQGDSYQSLYKILQFLTTSQNDLNYRVKKLEANQNLSQPKITTVENDKTEPFTVASHRIKIKQKCYVYSSSTFDINQRIRLATNEELADQLIEKHAYSKYGRLRYKVKDGFITANPDFVQKVN